LLFFPDAAQEHPDSQGAEVAGSSADTGKYHRFQDLIAVDLHQQDECHTTQGADAL